ncbi:TadE/TadG family type IV pilus assembly protein [Novosphingobium sp.]|uniref:TadE/TadG family type IV pilus assembly protein n=1 Tax=Novosphingobium sp. TaxID=1874826 RepID=UPI00286C442D|nr:TadE/TadG family type IV pilus assembly protein [Novosphingobium sp.]
MIGRITACLARLRSDTAGSVVVETAIVAPVLVTLGLGAFDISRLIARQSELQAGSTDVEGIVLAVAGTSTATNVSTIKSVLMNSLSLSANKVTVVKMYRCNVQTTLTTTNGDCGSNDVLSTYVQVTLTDSYTPMWTKFGLGSTVNYSLVRTVQVS